MIYFDTAYLAKCYINEIGSGEVRKLAGTTTRVACCEYGRVELIAAFHRAAREGRIDEHYFGVILSQFDRDEEDELWNWLPLTPALLGSAFLEYRHLPRSVFLRTADAIHLCCARDAGFDTIYSNDSHLLLAAPHFGLRGENVIG